MTLQLLHSKFPYIWGKFDFLFLSVQAKSWEWLAGRFYFECLHKFEAKKECSLIFCKGHADPLNENIENYLVSLSH
jgi:hypothetical protein